ncbi:MULTISPECIES: metallophosphoesterase [Anaerostipes]|uniref:metallophosphoesterase n=1 Tax=Anaerostipes TaxID=207244 RepID=UPI001C1E148C|nr:MULTISPECIES: metallophosphoesterase [Anaerostipes]MCI5622294.1 metallophosphoesterase [Anaerostipes sp.]MDY2725201.1 metallophosphoesterase [Anaerostipes faecalis]
MIPLLTVVAVVFFVSVVTVMVIVSNIENKKLTVENYTISSIKIPRSFDGFRIVFLTDLHCNEFGTDNSRLIEKIDQCCPNLILVGGDMVVGKENQSTDVPLRLMRNLAEKYLVYYADGNHEMKLMRNEEIFGLRYKEYVHQLKEYGVQHISNETIVLEQDGGYISLTALDLDKRFYQRFRIPDMTREDIVEVIGKEPDRLFRILLAHNPNYFKAYAQWGSDVVLSGHFHGGMIRIPGIGGVISPQFQLFPKYDAGEYHLGDSTMILSRGLGNHSIKLRLFNKPEISCIILKRQENADGN